MPARPEATPSPRGSPRPLPPGTRERLIEAAGEVFAELGYRDTTIREVCARADANIAAVHYHFGDKERLYLEVLRYARSFAETQHPFPSARGLAPRDQLRAFVRTMMFRLLETGRPAWHTTLMAREMVDPSPALDAIIENLIRPTWDMLRGIVAGNLHVAPDHPAVAPIARSVIGQVLFYKNCKPVIDRLAPDAGYSSAAIAERAEHVARFSLAALAGLSAGTRRPRGASPSAFPVTPGDARRRARVSPRHAARGARP